jgi:hypothetical protein
LERGSGLAHYRRKDTGRDRPQRKRHDKHRNRDGERGPNPMAEADNEPGTDGDHRRHQSENKRTSARQHARADGEGRSASTNRQSIADRGQRPRRAKADQQDDRASVKAYSARVDRTTQQRAQQYLADGHKGRDRGGGEPPRIGTRVAASGPDQQRRREQQGGKPHEAQ